MAGEKEKIEGKAKEMKGKVTGDREKEAEGKADQVKGQVKKATDKSEDRADESMESLKQDDTI